MQSDEDATLHVKFYQLSPRIDILIIRLCYQLLFYQKSEYVHDLIHCGAIIHVL